MAKIPVCAMVFTLNEEINLPTCLASLTAFEQVIVVDSFSSDATKKIAIAAKAEFHQHEFRGFGDQRNWALTELDLRCDWVLILDADERVPSELAKEISSIVNGEPAEAAFKIRRRFYLWGRWLKHSSLYPNWVVRLIHKDRVVYENRGHAETQTLNGELGSLEHDLLDENLKGIDDWYSRQLRYAEQEAEYELSMEAERLALSDLFSADPLLRRLILKKISWRMPCRAIVYFFYAYFFRLGFLDGVAGYRFCLMKASYQHMIAVKKAGKRSL